MRKIRWPNLGAVIGMSRQQPELPSRIIVGLGNPGSEHVRARHNVGFWCLDYLAGEHSISYSRRNRSALIGEGIVEGHRVVLVKPRTFVNRSGDAVTYLLARYRVAPERLLVVYDDMELPLGKMRLRPEGSSGGHNGIKSIIDALDTRGFPRLRIGIGRPPAGSDRIGYVLGAMSEDEQATVDVVVERSVHVVASLLTDGMSVAMNRFN